MSVKIPNHEKMLLDWFVPVLASLTCYSTDFYEFFFNLAVILEICKLDSEDAIFQFANIGFWIQHTKIPLIGISKPFLHKMPVPS